MLPAHRRVLQQIALAVLDHAIESLSPAVDPLQNCGHRQKLERAAQCEPFCGAMLQTATGGGIERNHAEAATCSLLEREDSICGDSICGATWSVAHSKPAGRAKQDPTTAHRKTHRS